MAFLDAYNEVSEVYEPGQLSTTFPLDDDLVMISGGAEPTSTARLHIDTAIPTNWTLEYTVRLTDIPLDFLDAVNRHVFIGVASANQESAGLFFTQQGLYYTGSVLFNDDNQLLLNHPTIILPNSYGMMQPGVYYTIRVAVDAATSTTYIYITETSQVPVVGQTLRYIMQSISANNAAQTPITGTVVSVKGTASQPSSLTLNSICLGAGLLIPNLPPVAIAGQDLAAQRCSVIRLNGEQSYDPEGTDLVYAWRLVDGPETSREVLAGSDGTTFAPSPLTNKFYSDELGVLHAIDEVVVGDVLQVYGDYHDIIAVGVDGTGFYVQVSEFSIPAPRAAATFKVLRQRGIAGATTVSPTFYVDVTGVFRFSLKVFDGQMYSLSSDTVANVVESEVPRGITPDASFLWGYLSNFWNLVDGTDPINTYWSAIAQITASELLALWQHDYSKGLRDVTKTFQRRWLHYDLLLKEPIPSQTSTEYIAGGALSVVIPAAGLSIVSQTLVMESPTLGSRTVRFQGDGMVDPVYLRNQVQTALGPEFTTSLVEHGTDFKLLVQSLSPFSLTAASTAELFDYPVTNGALQGSGGSPASTLTYRVDRSLEGMGIRAGDYLVVGDTAYRIARLTSDLVDPGLLQRVIVEEPLPLSASSNWSIARATKSSFLDFYNALVTAGDVAIYDVFDNVTDTMGRIATKVLSAPKFLNNAELLVDCGPLLPYLRSPDRFTVVLDAVVRRTHIPVDPLVVDIPYLQEFIKTSDDSSILRQNVDFFLDTYRGKRCVRFVTHSAPDPDVWEYACPPDRMWAELTYLDNRPTIEAMYGKAVDFTLDDLAGLPSNTDYLSVVRGLWYAYLNGPTVHHLRVGTQILLGLPFAEEAGTLIDIQPRFSPTQGRILVQDLAPPNVVRSYTYPRQLELEVNPETKVPYTVGDRVPQFYPLVAGAEIVDYVKDPQWWKPYQQQGSMLEVEKFFKFLVRVDSDAFSLPTLMFVRQFILRVKPTFTFPLFVVQRQINEATVEVIDQLRLKGTLNLFDGVCSFHKGIGMLFDEPDPSGGGTQTQFDSAYPLEPPPVYPAVAPIVYWGYDREMLCPRDYITGSACVTYAVPTYPTMDSIWSYDHGVFTNTWYDEGTSNIMSLPVAPEAVQLGLPVTAAGSYTISSVEFRYDATFPAAQPIAALVTLLVNDAVVDVLSITIPTLDHYTTFIDLILPVEVTAGDVVTAFVSADGASPLELQWATVGVRAGTIYNWSYDDQAPAGTYCVTKVM